MNPTLPAEATQFGASAVKAFEAHGGVDLARRAESDPATRAAVVTPVLASLGADDLDPRDNLDSAAAAGELCRAVGRVVLPFPVVSWLLSVDGAPLAVIAADGANNGAGDGAGVDHGDMFDQWTTATLQGRRGRAHPTGKPWASRLGPFVSRLDVDSTEEGEVGHDVLLHLTLTAWQVLGTLERAVELAVGHVKDRVQFNKPLSAFQAVQFQLADASVAVTGLRQLCQFTLWRVATDPHAAIADALAVRLAALDSARTVLRTTQQLFGASGLCDEYDISILVRHVQPALRLPWGADHTAEHLARAVRQVGFDSLFPHGATRP